MKLLMLIVDGYEDTECIATLDVVTRGGDEVTLTSLMNRKEIKPKLGRTLIVDTVIEKIDYKKIQWLNNDASGRKYGRIKKDKKSFILMDSPLNEKPDLFYQIDELLNKNNIPYTTKNGEIKIPTTNLTPGKYNVTINFKENIKASSYFKN